MATKVHKTLQKKAKTAVPKRARKKVRGRRIHSSSSGVFSVADLRKSLGINRKLFARLTGYSERAIAQWEGGTKLSSASLQKMTETRRLHQALAAVIKPDFVPQWLQQPNNSFGGLKPIEVVERGEVDRIWQMVFELGTGMPG